MPKKKALFSSIKKSKDFHRLKKHGYKIYTSHFVICITDNNLPISRLSIIATKKLGGSVVRNRIRRIYRHIFRNTANALCLKGYDVLIIAKANLKVYNFEMLFRSFQAAISEFMNLQIKSKKNVN